MSIIRHDAPRVQRADYADGFDKIASRMTTRLPVCDMRFLGKNASSVDQRKGHPLRDDDREFLLTLVCPNAAARKFIAERDDMMINYVEVARDYHTPDERSSRASVDDFDRHFVQGRHGKDETWAEENGSYTRRNRPGLRYVYYGDRPSKRTGRPCFHIEARAHGVGSVRQLGINHPRDLLTFDHAAFWRKRLRLFTIDFERLGRWYENRRLKERRQKPLVTSGYNRDLRTGSTLFRIFGETNAFARYCAAVDRQDPEFEQRPDIRIIDRSVQRFVDRFGRGPFLRPITSLCYVNHRMLLIDDHSLDDTRLSTSEGQRSHMDRSTVM